MTIPTGRYFIQNVRSKNQLQLPDPNDGSAVQATSEDSTGTLPLKVQFISVPCTLQRGRSHVVYAVECCPTR